MSDKQRATSVEAARREPPTAAERADKARLRDYVSLWGEATSRQRDRVLGLSVAMMAQPLGVAFDEACFHVEADVVLFAVALRNLLRSVEWAQNTYAPALSNALDQFRADVPHAVDLRDLLEHFDDYEQGKGKLQRPEGGRQQADGIRPKPKIVGYAYWFAHTDGTVRLEFGGSRTLDVVKAANAAASLVEAGLTSLS